MADRLLNIDELAEALELPRSSLNRFAIDKRIPSLVIGGRRRFNLAAVERVLLDLASEGVELTGDGAGDDADQLRFDDLAADAYAEKAN